MSAQETLIDQFKHCADVEELRLVKHVGCSVCISESICKDCVCDECIVEKAFNEQILLL